MSEQWLKDYEKAKKSAQQLIRDLDGKAPGKTDAKQAALLRGNVAQLRQEVTQLQKTLMVMSQNTQAYDVTRKELSRRGDLLSELNDQFEEIQEMMRSGVRKRVEGAVDAPWRGRESSRGVDDDSSGGNANAEGRDLVTCSEMEINRQNDSLDFLHGTVQNLKGMGGNITQEIDLHCRLLGEMDDSTDSASRMIKQQQVRLAALSDQEPSCALWAYVVLLVVTLFVLLVFF
eukprot:TRINITY_DN70358_c0_g1_i1.p1 TRINITY_DN70358_c0_g1~~TRINITY_DN70358_c0_g1_i1.p1  ORF type:complete len:231 (-),score=56.75 TRINITY_DN70358_c0_g1_i1:224-916(-)